MEQRTYHGKITPQDLAQVLQARFSTDDTSAVVAGQADKLVVTIKASGYSGGPTSLSVGLAPVSDGVTVTVGDQNLLGVAADLLQTGLGALWNPVTLLGQIGDVARDVGRLTLPQEVWKTVEHYAQSVGAGLTPEISAVICAYCGVQSPIGTGQCPACGAPLTRVQPIACPKCGKRMPADLKFCTRCGATLTAGGQASGAAGTGAGKPPFLAQFG
jgi:hypothetical protein